MRRTNPSRAPAKTGENAAQGIVAGSLILRSGFSRLAPELTRLGGQPNSPQRGLPGRIRQTLLPVSV
jgi:hypothetical protein